MKPRQYAGLAILLTVAIIVAAVKLWPDSSSDHGPNPDPPEPITVTGIIGGKVAFFQDPDIVNFLKTNYGLTVEYKRVPSIDMINQCQSGLDYCWPSSQMPARRSRTSSAPRCSAARSSSTRRS